MDDFEYMFQNKKFTIISITVILIAIGAAIYFSQISSKRDDIISFSEDDAEMNLAIKTAKSTLNHFENALLSNDSNFGYFGLKIRYETFDDIEYIWVKDVYFKDNEFYGYVDSKPYGIDKIKLGDLVEINKNNISDWLYYDSAQGVFYGGYTIVVIKNRLSKKEQKEGGFDKMLFAPDNPQIVY